MKKILIPVAILGMAMVSANGQAPATVSKQKTTSSAQPASAPVQKHAPAVKAATPATEIHATPKPAAMSDQKEPAKQNAKMETTPGTDTKAAPKSHKTAPASVATGKSVKPREGSHGKTVAPVAKQNEAPAKPIAPQHGNKK